MYVSRGAGKPFPYARTKERLSEAKKKPTKILSLTKGGWRAMNIMHARVVFFVAYSARLNGVCNEVLETTRTILRTVTSTVAAGGSATLDMMLQKSKYIDPAHAATTLPPIEWAPE